MSQNVSVGSIQISINGEDKKQIDNLIRIMAKAKVELVGVEILAASDAMRWLSSFQSAVEKIAIAKAQAEQQEREAMAAAAQAIAQQRNESPNSEPTKFDDKPVMQKSIPENLTKGPFNAIEDRVTEAREQSTRRPKGKK